MSKVPDVQLPTIVEHCEILASARVTTLTPVIGAGVHSQRVDRSHPVRGETVRGHLRFWWRTVSQPGPLEQWIDKLREEEARKRSLSNLPSMEELDPTERLRIREAWIWGSTSRAGLVVVRVQNKEWKNCNVRHKKLKDVVQGLASIMDVQGNQSGSLSIAYAAFPLQEQNSDPPGAVSEVGMGSFLVTIVWNSWARELIKSVEGARFQVEQEIREALWRWIHFGGLGMRWRRGFGALTSDDVPGRLDDFREHIRSHPSACLPCVRAVLVQSPNQRPRRNMARSTVWDAWEDCLQTLRQYRQPRQPKNGPTRSFTKTPWPEASVIRAIHRGRGNPKNGALRFPRAVLGLPVIFQFKGESTPNAELRPDKSANPLLGRLPSPFILRPVRIGDAVYPMCVWLESPLPSHQEHGFVRMSLKVGSMAPITVPATAALSAMEDRFKALEGGEVRFEKTGDALEDFLRHLRKQGFEVLYRSDAT
ncbi:type III-B CRISPR module RAMP protein Cmr1 [Alicyclobacillus acidocaldarius]|uniref:CRISPR-associated RAMP protein, Cmr1 family n=1 Tax=Alicyclobacillus acidocaldarius subsp. acidocaldarius (strain ATCC 27009 / DSM 446 / BCRC 14685 / JCM 5260 / KCTC 1825 / NBRC 15652 / NCIMB 11725 / NRRL B-14509 / 104-IA) TaxID=521098 RepID=C8WRP6_ALIAD|nr:type III-B CRISPR module RAMP protein Cmr1 [Alicyclobacillus acidocaldarius]ACV59307.1 CRISPR-associated RAMP protein, Cmr1 family [Alicyclobacillus acidocaldarius subsp. acidocaldarius DSM 446]